MRQLFSTVLWIVVVSSAYCGQALGQEQAEQKGVYITSREELIARCLRINRFFMDKYSQKEGPLVIEPVALPWGDELLGDNAHFGWPVATRTGDTVIVVYLRQPQHTPRFGITKPKDQYLSKVMMTRSTDGCKTWSKPVDMRTFVKTPTEGCRLGFGNGMVTLEDGTVVLVSEYGVFRSSDQGATWEHLPQAYSEAQLPGDKANNGPRVIEHPKYGLVTFAHGKGSDLVVRYSQDRGETWHEIVQQQPEIAQAVEPAAMMYEGSLIIVARCHAKESYEPETRTWRYLQLVSRDGWLPLTPALTTMRVTDITDEIAIDGYGPWSQDTVDVSYNPVTKRIETVATNRNGGGQGREQQRLRMTLNLWSIDPQQLLDGSSDWRFEGTLIARTGNMVTGTDGMHPGGAVIDEKAGVQHIFVYMGEHLGPAGIFRITRTLDTPALKAFIDAHPE